VEFVTYVITLIIMEVLTVLLIIVGHPVVHRGLVRLRVVRVLRDGRDRPVHNVLPITGLILMDCVPYVRLVTMD